MDLTEISSFCVIYTLNLLPTRSIIVNLDVTFLCTFSKLETLVIFSDDVWIHLGGCVLCQNITQWSEESSMSIYDVPLYDVKIGVLCAMSAISITGTIFWAHNFTPLLHTFRHHLCIHVRLRQNLRIFFSRIVQSIVRVVYTVFSDRIIKLWIVTSALTELRHAWADMFVECDAICQPKEATSSTFFCRQRKHPVMTVMHRTWY